MNGSVTLVQLHELIGIAEKPPYVKAASEQVQRSAPEPRHCADGLGCRYPCDSKEQTWLSAVKLAAAGGDTEIQAGIEKFARFWGITADVQAAQKKIAAQLAVPALEDRDFALVQEHRGEKIRKFAAFDSNSTVKAATAFYENRHRYPMAWRKQAAVELIRRSEAHLAQLPPVVNDYLHKAAGFGFPSVEAIENAILDRTGRCQGHLKSAGVKLAEALGAIAAHPDLRYNNDLVRDALEVMDRFDRSTKLAAHYGDDVSLPEEMLDLTQPMLQKAAGYVAGQCKLQNGINVNVHDLTKEALAAVSDELAEMPLAKLAAVLPTLPAPDANVLCRASGISTKQAAAGADLLDVLRKRAGAAVPPTPGAAPAPQDPGATPMPPGQDPAAAAAPQPGPGAVPGAPAPGQPPPAPGAPGAAPAAPPLEKVPGQAPAPGATPAGQSALAAGTPPSPQAAPGEVAGGPLDAGGNAPEPGAIFDAPLFDPGSVEPPKNLDPTKDPAMQAAAPGSDAGASLADAGGGAGDVLGGAGPGAAALAQEQPPRQGVTKDQVSGLPQGV